MSEIGLERARSLQDTRRHEDALEVLGEVLRDDPENACAHCMKATSLALLHRFEEAEASAQLALSLEPSNSLCAFTYGRILIVKGDYAARKWLNSCLELAPEDPSTLGLLASIYLIDGKLKEGIRFVDRGLQRDPENYSCLWIKANILVAQGKSREGEQVTRALLALHPHSAEGVALLHRLEAGDASRPDAALQMDPRSPMVRSFARDEILVGSGFLAWVPRVDDLKMRVGVRLLLAILVLSGIALRHFVPLTVQAQSPWSIPALVVWRCYSVLLLAYYWGRDLGNAYLVFHAKGRWLLRKPQQLGGRLASITFAIGVPLSIALSLLAQLDLAAVAWGFSASGLVTSSALTVMSRPPTNVEIFAGVTAGSFAFTAAMESFGLVSVPFVVGLSGGGYFLWALFCTQLLRLR